MHQARRSQKKEESDVLAYLCSRDHTQANILSKSSRKSVECDLKQGSGRKASIAGHAFLPIETVVCSLCSGLQVSVLGLHPLFELYRAKGKGDGLCTKQTRPSTADGTAWPITPKKRMRSRWRKWEKRFLQYRRSFKRVRRLIWSGGRGVD